MSNTSPLKENSLEKNPILLNKIKEYESQTHAAARKIKKLTALKSKCQRDYQLLEKINENYQLEESEVYNQVADCNNLMQSFKKSINIKLNRSQQQNRALIELQENINKRKDEVYSKIGKLQEAVLEWQVANVIVTDFCKTVGSQVSEKFHIWHQTIPILNSWLRSESKMHSAIYSTSQFLGLNEELQEQTDLKKQLEDFTEFSYRNKVLTEILPPIKQINEERQERADSFDQFHLKLLRQLRFSVRQLDHLQTEIEEREKLRAKLISLTMELKNAIDIDLNQSLQNCEQEAKRPIGQILNSFVGYNSEERNNLAKSFLNKNLCDILSFQNGFQNIQDINSKFSEALSSLNQESLVSSLSGSEFSNTGPNESTVPSYMNTTFSLSHERKFNRQDDINQKFIKEFLNKKESFKASKTIKVIENLQVDLHKLILRMNPVLLRAFEYIHFVDKENPNSSPNNYRVLKSASTQEKEHYSIDSYLQVISPVIKESIDKDHDTKVIKCLSQSEQTITKLQHICSTATFEAITMVSNILDKIKEKELANKNDDNSMAINQPESDNNQSTGGPIFINDNERVWSANTASTNSRLTHQSSHEANRDLLQYLAAQELISKVSAAFNSNRSALEDWMLESMADQFKSSQETLEKKLISMNLLSEDSIKKKKIENKVIPSSQTSYSEEKLLDLLDNIPRLDEFSLKPIDPFGDVETEKSVKDMLSLSEQLLNQLSNLSLN